MAPQAGGFNVCDYFGFLLVAYCTAPIQREEIRLQKRAPDGFQLEFQWSHVNFTWNSVEEYKDAIARGGYIPENNVISGMKIYKDKLYLALPRVRNGTPVTLASISLKTKMKRNPLLIPFPSWSANVQNSCTTFQNVQNIEIDRRGVMWVLDGLRINSLSSCPPKLVLLDLRQNGKIVHIYIFRNEIALRSGAFLTDLVVDDFDGGYAYITDSSPIDPGLIVYSRQQSRAWKLRDPTMYANFEASNFTVDSIQVIGYIGINGIALSPVPNAKNEERLVYYTSLNSFDVRAISTKILRNEPFCRTSQWRKYVKHVGRKKSQTDGLMIDNAGNLYFGLLNVNGVGVWNIFEPFENAKQFDHNTNELIWPDGFAMDNSGYLYVISNSFIKYLDTSYPLLLSANTKFRILKKYVGFKNYMFTR